MYYAYAYSAHARELLLKVMAVLAKVGMLHEQLPSVIVDPCLYYICTVHQALAAFHSLCTEGCVRTVRSMCVCIRNVTCGLQLLYSSQVWTGFVCVYCIMLQYASKKPVRICTQSRVAAVHINSRITLRTPTHVDRTVLAQPSVHRE